MIPGSRAIYRLTVSDAIQINRRRTTSGSIVERIKLQLWPIGAQAHIGTEVEVGQEFPMIIVRVHDILLPMDTETVSGQVFLDGNDVLWVQKIREGLHNGEFFLVGMA